MKIPKVTYENRVVFFGGYAPQMVMSILSKFRDA